MRMAKEIFDNNNVFQPKFTLTYSSAVAIYIYLTI